MKRFTTALALLFIVGATVSLRADTSVVFNEIMYHPPTNETTMEWVEFYNQMAVNVDISGWSVTGGIQYTFPSNTIVRGGGYLLLALSPETMAALTGLTNVCGPFAGRLSNSGEELQLCNNSGRIVDTVSYGVDGDWPVAPNGSGESLAKRDRDTASGPAEDWAVSEQMAGTPGTANFAPPGAAPPETQLVPIEAVWKYEASGANLGTAWREPGYNDVSWPARSGFASRPIPTLFNTGVNDNGAALAPGSADPHYILTQCAQGTPGMSAIAMQISSGWIENDSASSWIGVVSSGAITVNAGDYFYQIRFDLTGFLPQTAQVSFSVAIDDRCNDVFLNGASTGLSFVGYWAYSPMFVLTNGFAARTNTLEFRTANDYGYYWNPHGFRALVSGTALGVNTNPPLPSGPTTYYFRRNFNFSGDPAHAQLKLNPIIADGAVVYLNGVEVYRQNLPGGAISYSTPALSNATVIGFSGPIQIPAGSLVFGNNAIAVEVHQAAGSADGPAWGTELSSTPLPVPPVRLAFNELSGATNAGFWLELVNYGTNPVPLAGYVISRTGSANSEYVFPSGATVGAGGYFTVTNTSLGFLPVAGDKLFLLTPLRDKVLDAVVVQQTPRARSPEATGSWLCPAAPTPGGVNSFTFHNELVINEIMYHHALLPDTNSDSSGPQPSSEAWIELFNRGSNVVDLTGWSLAGGIQYQFPFGKTISPGGYLVVAKDAAAFHALYPAVDSVGNFSGKLSHGGDLIVLNDAAGNPANQVRYYDSGHWPAYADGGGSSLELRDPKADNSKAEAWAASDESGKSAWQTYSYRMVAQTQVGTRQWNDFILGLLERGECLVDDISVIESPSSSNPVQFISNGNFENGLTGWRVLGTHNRSRVEPEPGNPANHVLHVIATGPQEHMHNHIETTLINGLTVTDGREYQISFRARWLAGNNPLNTRLYFDRVARTTALPVPALNGTPGAQNSCYATNLGPTFGQFQHNSVIPQPDEPVTVSVAAQDPQGVSSCSVWWSANGGAWSSASMALQSGGLYSGTIPGQAAGTVVQFYVRATDGLGAAATYPAGGTNSAALYAVADGQADLSLGHNLRIILTPANRSLLHAFTNVQSNDNLPCTVVYDEQRAYYDMGVRLKGSERGRYSDTRVSFHLQFRPDDLFRGVHPVMLIDRSGTGDSDYNKQEEILIRHILLRAGGIPGTQPDMCRVIAPFSAHTGPAIFSPRFEDEFIDTAYDNGGDGSEYEYEEIYYPLTADPSGYKYPQPDDYWGVDISDLGDDKEVYRYSFIVKNHRDADDYSRLIPFAKAFSLSSGPLLAARTRQLMDVDEWIRTHALESLCGVSDSYTFGSDHNLLLYVRPSDQKMIAFSWDMDFSFYRWSGSPLIGDRNLGKIFNLPANRRALYNHALDIIGSAYNTGYMTYWVSHYQSFAPGQDYSGVLGYIQDRINAVNSEINNAGGNAPFAVNEPTTITTGNNLVTFSGTAPVQVKTIRINGIEYPVTWTSVSDWTISLPVSSPTNVLNVLAYDLHGNPLTNFNGTVTVVYTGAPVSPGGKVVINEIMYTPSATGASYVELLNTSSNLSFDLSGWRVNGLSYTFPPGSIIANGQFLVLAEDMSVFGTTYGTGVPAFDQFSGHLQADGETLTLLAPGSGTNEIIVDQVRYEAQAPWPATAPGVSLQLVDAAQDNSRIANWSMGNVNFAVPPQSLFDYTNVWKFMQVSNLDAVSWYAPNYDDSAWPSGPGLLAFENNPAITPLIRTPLTDPRTPPPGLTAGHADYFRTTLNLANDLSGFTVTADAYIDDGAILYVNGAEIPTRIRMAAGTALNSTLADGSPPGGDATSPDIFAIPGSMFGTGTNVIAVEVHQVATTSTDVVFGLKLEADFTGSLTAANTPGATNSVAATLPAFPSVWLNEVQADNVTGPLDNFSQHDPWIELYNSGTNALDLSGFFLSDNYTNLAQWAFPTNASIPAGGFLVVWCDNQTNQTATNALHTNFRPGSGAGRVALSRRLGGTNQILDYLNYTNLQSNWSYGDSPDGQPFYRGKMFFATPGGANNAASAPIEIYLNEWMADNVRTIANPLNGSFDDWFELYNPGTNAVDLGGYYLTGNLTNKTKFLIPNNGHYLVPPGGYFLVWADNNSGQNNPSRPELHVNFKLSKAGEAIGLFTSDGMAIDAVTFGAQTTDISEGRFPNGAANRFFMPTPTPGAANIIPNTAPVLTTISNRFVHLGQTVAFIATATDAESEFQTLSFSLDPGAPVGASISTAGAFAWTTTNAAVPGTNSITVRVTDNGTPPLSDTKAFLVFVQPLPQLGLLPPDGDGQFNIQFGTLTGQMYQLEYKDNLTDLNWTPLGPPVTGTGNPAQISDNFSNRPLRFYRLVVLP